MMPPVLTFDQKSHSVSIQYEIKEGAQVIIKKVNINNVGPPLQEKIKKELVNKEGGKLMVTSLEKDLTRVLKIMRNEGYFFSKITNLNSNDLIVYDDTHTHIQTRSHDDLAYVTINVNLSKEKKVRLEKVLITGNSKTKYTVIKREVDLFHSDIITLNKIDEIKDNLQNLGIFSFVKVIPVVVKNEKETQWIHLLIQLKEKDTIIFEIAPGYRTDIGAKLSTSLTKKNFTGMNRTLSIKGLVNHRFSDFSNLDVRRRLEKKKSFEYSTQLAYSEPYLGGWPIEWDFALSSSKKKLFSFDATISKISMLFSKSFGNVFIPSLKYQVEAITQFDATDVRDNGFFRIGGLTPGLAFDFRDHPVGPRKGAYLDISWEFANPTLLSQKRKSFQNEGDLEINYYKLISRNKFYFPLGNFGVIAFSLSLGYQRNLANEPILDQEGKPRFDAGGNLLRKGYIPSIKVFRLNGFNAVRGYGQDEINRLDSQVYISEVVVGDDAYLTNFKFEPRYYLTDSFVAGLFFDAGNVDVDGLWPKKLRTSAGATLKYVTPVGSLDFDYGIKLKRRAFLDGTQEKFGRFHLSIGLF